MDYLIWLCAARRQSTPFLQTDVAAWDALPMEALFHDWHFRGVAKTAFDQHVAGDPQDDVE